MSLFARIAKAIVGTRPDDDRIPTDEPPGAYRIGRGIQIHDPSGWSQPSRPTDLTGGDVVRMLSRPEFNAAWDAEAKQPAASDDCGAREPEEDETP